ncbi:MAG: cytochrome c biogenesis protein CcdA [Betaproteobacteria bacterium]
MFDVVLALLAGVVTVAAPCTLPMLPIILGASVGQTGKGRPVMIALGFVVSFSATALLLSAITGIFDFDPNTLRTAAITLLLGFGLLMIWPTALERLSFRTRRLINARSTGNTASFEGATIVATSKDTAQASALLVVYAVGAAIPMLAIAYGGQAVTTRVRSIARISPRLQQAFGAVVISFAIASYFQYDTLIVAWLTGFYPSGQTGL